MKRALAFLLLLACALPARAAYEMWGIETWQCGDSLFQVSPGFSVARISGVISAAPLPGADVSANGGIIRQGLLAIFTDYNSPAGSKTGNPTGTTPQKWNHSLDHHYFAAVIKQSGQNVVHIPFSVTLDTPYSGTFLLNVQSQSYGPNGQLSSAIECLNVEAHVQLGTQ